MANNSYWFYDRLTRYRFVSLNKGSARFIQVGKRLARFCEGLKKVYSLFGGLKGCLAFSFFDKF